MAWRKGASPAALSATAGNDQLAVAGKVTSTTGFLGQFSAVDEVELRAQVGGTLTTIDFQDGQIVHKGDPLFVIDPRPFRIRLDQAVAQFETAQAKEALAKPSCGAPNN